MLFFFDFIGKSGIINIQLWNDDQIGINSMIIKSIKLKNFRNYENLDLEFNDRLNIIIGGRKNY